MIGEESLSTYGEIQGFEAKLNAAFRRLDGERASLIEMDEAGTVIYVDFGFADDGIDNWENEGGRVL